MIRIGRFELATNLLLSPLAGYCDMAYRLVVRPLGGLGLAYTDLVNPRGIANQTARSMQIVRTCAADAPLSIQLYGTEADELADAAVWAAEHGSVIVDINFGCPVPKVAGRGGGSGVLRNCPDAVRIAAAMVKKCPVPVTVKTRLGWEMGNLVAPDLARRLEDVGVAALTIHGRYGEQKFSGAVDRAGIRKVVEAVRSIPVFGNGDILNPHDAKRMLEETGCAGVMIGRRALSDPWIFRDTHAFLSTGRTPPAPSKIERVEKMIEHFGNMIDQYGERSAAVQFRKRMSWYCKTLSPCPNLRRHMPRISSKQEFDDLVNEYLDELRASDGLGAAAALMDAA